MARSTPGNSWAPSTSKEGPLSSKEMLHVDNASYPKNKAVDSEQLLPPTGSNGTGSPGPRSVPHSNTAVTQNRCITEGASSLQHIPYGLKAYHSSNGAHSGESLQSEISSELPVSSGASNAHAAAKPSVNTAATEGADTEGNLSSASESAATKAETNIGAQLKSFFISLKNKSIRLVVNFILFVVKRSIGVQFCFNALAVLLLLVAILTPYWRVGRFTYEDALGEHTVSVFTGLKGAKRIQVIKQDFNIKLIKKEPMVKYMKLMNSQECRLGKPTNEPELNFLEEPADEDQLTTLNVDTDASGGLPLAALTNLVDIPSAELTPESEALEINSDAVAEFADEATAVKPSIVKAPKPAGDGDIDEEEEKEIEILEDGEVELEDAIIEVETQIDDDRTEQLDSLNQETKEGEEKEGEEKEGEEKEGEEKQAEDTGLEFSPAIAHPSLYQNSPIGRLPGDVGTLDDDSAKLRIQMLGPTVLELECSMLKHFYDAGKIFYALGGVALGAAILTFLFTAGMKFWARNVTSKVQSMLGGLYLATFLFELISIAIWGGITDVAACVNETGGSSTCSLSASSGSHIAGTICTVIAAIIYSSTLKCNRIKKEEAERRRAMYKRHNLSVVLTDFDNEVRTFTAS